MHLAAHELVAAADELDKLARVNVGVAPVLDVLEELRRHRGEVVRWRGSRVERLEGSREGFAARETVLLAKGTVWWGRARWVYTSLESTSLLGRPMES